MYTPFIFIYTLIIVCASADYLESHSVKRGLEQFVTENGYKIENHYVITEDGYILNIHRICPKGTGCVDKTSNVVFLVPGLVETGVDWISSGKNRSLAFLLVDNGYDVWLGNNRGTTFSKNHTTLPVTDKAFWDFSYHELGLYDATASIDYILEKTRQEQLFYIGFSQGTTQFWVMTSLRPEYNKKIKFMVALAPVAYLGHVKGVLRPAGYTSVAMQALFDGMGYFEIIPSSLIFRNIIANMCGSNIMFEPLCEMVTYSIAGFGIKGFDRKNFGRYLQYIPAGCSLKQLLHYAQGIVHAGQFRPYNYGTVKNLEVYKKKHPVEYPLHEITVPVGLYFGENDYLAPQKDVELLRNKLPNVSYIYVVPLDEMNHFDFMFGLHARSIIYDHIIEKLNTYQ